MGLDLQPDGLTAGQQPMGLLDTASPTKYVQSLRKKKEFLCLLQENCKERHYKDMPFTEGFSQRV